MDKSEKKKLALVAQGGTLDKLYCALILASTALAIDVEAYLYLALGFEHACERSVGKGRVACDI